MSAREYVDDPLEPITQDNVDVELRVGPRYSFERASISATDKPVIQPTEEARSYDIIEAEVELVDGTESNYMTAIVVGDGHNILPSEGDPLNQNEPPEIVTLDVDNELTEAERDSEEITRIFTGVIANASRLGDGQFEFVAFWPGFNEIQDEDIIISPPPGLTREEVSVDYNPRRQRVSQLAGQVGSRLTFDTLFDYEINVQNGGVPVGERPGGAQIRSGFNPEVTLDSLREPIKSLLDGLELKSEAIWDVDRYGDFYFGAINPRAHKIRYITDSSAGKQSPAWRSVRVIGDGVVSEDGWGSSAMINEDPEAVQGNISDDDPDDTLAEPTFVYRNMEVNTQEEAQHVMNKLREEIRSQAAGGEVDIVGHPELWPGDAIELPDSEDQPFQLERFGIKKVIHRLNNTDGFTTKVECGGLTNGEETTFESELSELIEDERIGEVVSKLRDLGFANVAELIENGDFGELSDLFRSNGYEDLGVLAVNEKYVEILNRIVELELEPEDLANE